MGRYVIICISENGRIILQKPASEDRTFPKTVQRLPPDIKPAGRSLFSNTNQVTRINVAIRPHFQEFCVRHFIYMRKKVPAGHGVSRD